MQKSFILLFVMAFSISLFAQQKSPQSYADQVAIFKESTHDFGTIKEGAPTSFDFTFTNKNTKPIVLNSVTSSCGCTVPEWPRTPIEPNKTAVIKVTYDSRRIGYFEKTIQVYVQSFNVPAMLKIKGEVLTAANYDSQHPSKTQEKNKKK